MSNTVEKLDCQDQVFAFLNLLRDSGKIVSEQEIPDGEYEWDTAWRVKE